MDKSKRAAVIAGNWKMNKTRPEAKALIEELKPLVAGAGCTVVICTPYTNLETAVALAAGSNIRVGAENCHWAEKGAFTGEIAPSMLTEIGVEYVIIGHSERRQYFGESDETVNSRAKAALAAGLLPIICVGELLAQREGGETASVIDRQVKVALADITAAQMKDVIIAYEPVWAIGTGKTATAGQANEVCAQIRAIVSALYGAAVGEGLTVQYGGSMNAANAAELLAQPDVDGGLIGGAALKAPDFAAIVAAAGK